MTRSTPCPSVIQDVLATLTQGEISHWVVSREVFFDMENFNLQGITQEECLTYKQISSEISFPVKKQATAF